MFFLLLIPFSWFIYVLEINRAVAWVSVFHNLFLSAYLQSYVNTSCITKLHANGKEYSIRAYKLYKGQTFALTYTFSILFLNTNRAYYCRHILAYIGLVITILAIKPVSLKMKRGKKRVRFWP